MPSVPQDTIVALATASASGVRAIVRMSGPGCLSALRAVFAAAQPVPPPRGRVLAGAVRLPGVAAPMPAELYYWPGPHSYTGQDVAELHVLGCPPLVEGLVARLLEAGCRAAGPGEFTQRAFLAGKIDLTRAEAVAAVIEASSRSELRQALGQLAGGITRPMAELRDDLLNLLADVEAGLDFADEDIRFVEPTELLLRIGKALAQLTLVGKQLDSRALAGQTFRVVLAGQPNVGKSSLFNALAGTRALVSDIPGTTRDYLSARLRLGEITVELIDTPGWQGETGLVEAQAQALARRQQMEADLVLLCLEAGATVQEEEEALLRQEQPPAVPVATKCDLAVHGGVGIATSATTGLGLDELRRLLAERARDRAEPALAPSVSRCRHHVQAGLECLRRAHAVVRENDPPEVLALELREALRELGEMAGAVFTDDLLDRVFSRFCIGK